ncbi:hypothetical protein [Xanthomonas sp. XNM01]|uniref:hypothetical protein n=1 Tax=Xanthomonas sp. XNM01 TaxID=2769289 RepID=UPI00177E742A|nr:hypothetical protein [Xanthomonas sp. XNM01]MBD9368356.1 hypothetical protein [Xanthomonas sp. XNM01]
MEMINAPTITITGAVESRYVTMKAGGQRQVFAQPATMSKPGMMLPTEIEVDSPNDGFPVGSTLVWDVTADVVPGQYGRLELSRKRTLRPAEPTKPAAKAS